MRLNISPNLTIGPLAGFYAFLLATGRSKTQMTASVSTSEK